MPYAAAPMVLTLLSGLAVVAFALAMIACVIEIFAGDYRARRSTRRL